jgi:hypothetical protein
MSILAALLTLMLLAAVMAVISRPLLVGRPPESTSRPEESGTTERSELEAEREAKYREIRDAELDYRTGKLSQEDYEAVNGTLRAEAVEILDKLESSQGAAEEDRVAAEEDRVAEEENRVAAEENRVAEEDRDTYPAK